MTLASVGVAILIVVAIGVGVYLGRTWPVAKGTEGGGRFPAAIGGLVCLVWLGVFATWTVVGGRAIRGWESFLRVGDLDLPNVFLVVASAAVFILHALGALVQSRVLRAIALAPAAYGTAHAGLFVFAVLQQGTAVEIGPVGTLGGFVLLLSATGAILARKQR
ncbi:MAG: hypothetical protein U0793_06925 [Gemmataceae bacterium]